MIGREGSAEHSSDNAPGPGFVYGATTHGVHLLSRVTPPGVNNEFHLMGTHQTSFWFFGVEVGGAEPLTTRSHLMTLVTDSLYNCTTVPLALAEDELFGDRLAGTTMDCGGRAKRRHRFSWIIELRSPWTMACCLRLTDLLTYRFTVQLYHRTTDFYRSSSLENADLKRKPKPNKAWKISRKDATTPRS